MAKKIKVGINVFYVGKPDKVFKVVRKIKGAKTNQPVYHSGVLLNGFKSTPTKYELDNGDICSPHQLTAITNQ